MEIIINDNMRLREIKEAFQARFKHLKLEFYADAHKEGEGSSKAALLDENLLISQARTQHQDGHLSINGHQKTKTLESRFKEIYGLNVQVFRKSGNIWLQSISTDEYTLSEQEQHAIDRENMH